MNYFLDDLKNIAEEGDWVALDRIFIMMPYTGKRPHTPKFYQTLRQAVLLNSLPFHAQGCPKGSATSFSHACFKLLVTFPL